MQFNFLKVDKHLQFHVCRFTLFAQSIDRNSFSTDFPKAMLAVVDSFILIELHHLINTSNHLLIEQLLKDIL